MSFNLLITQSPILYRCKTIFDIPKKMPYARFFMDLEKGGPFSNIILALLHAH